MRTGTNTLFGYLRAAKIFGPCAGKVSLQFCKSVLGIPDPVAVVGELQSLGVLVEVTDGFITLAGEERR